MSWLFSQALVVEFSAGNCSDGERSAPLSLMPTPHRFWHNGRTMASSRLSRFGLTCAVLTETAGEALLTSFLAAFRARTSPSPAVGWASPANAQGSGRRWHESSVKYDRHSSSWKTHRCLFDEDLPWSSVTLPSWGMTLDGVLWEPPISGRPIAETGSGFWGTPGAVNTRPGATPMKLASVSGTHAATRFPTPLASDWKRNGSPQDRRRNTPSLGAAVKMWPTPNASDADKWNNKSLEERQTRGQQVRLNTAVSPQGGSGGRLNPTWVEWLMGWPLGWTDLRPLAMDRYQEWRQQHSLFLPAMNRHLHSKRKWTA